MKYLLAAIFALTLAGCQTTPVVKTEIVTVDRPVAFVPKPPDVPKLDSQVDKLTDADLADPGKIGMAYKYDMMFLRSIVPVYEAILNQYRQSSANFDKINADIKTMVDQINAQAAAKAAEQSKTPSR